MSPDAPPTPTLPIPERPRARVWSFVRWATFAAACGIFVWALRKADLGRVVAAIEHVGPAIFLALLPFVVAIGLDALGWRLVFRAIGRRVSWLGLWRVRITTEAVLMSLPGGAILAETLAPVLLRDRCAVPISEGFATLGAKKCLFTIAHGLVIALGAVVGFGALEDVSRAVIRTSGLPWIVLVAGLGVAVASTGVLAFFLFGGVGERLHGALRALAPLSGIRAWLDEKRAGFVETDRHFERLHGADRRPIAVSMVVFVTAWLVEAVETLLILHLLGTPLGIVQVVSFEASVSMLRALAFFAPAGLGVQDLGYMTFFQAFGLPDPLTSGAAFVLLKRAKELFWIVVGYVLLLASGSGPALRRTHGGAAVAAPSSS